MPKWALLQVFSFDLAAKALQALGVVLLIRWMAPAEFARYTFVFAGAVMLSQTLSLVFNRVYLLADNNGCSDCPGTFLVAQLGTCTALAVLLLPLSGSCGDLYLPLCLLTTGYCLLEFAKTVYQREMNFLRFSLLEVSRSTLFALAVIGIEHAAPFRLGAMSVVMVQACGSLLIASLTLGIQMRGRFLFEWGAAARLFADIAAFRYGYLTGYFILLAIQSNLPIFLLRGLTDNHEQATFAVAFRIYAMLSMALTALHAVLLPALQHASGLNVVNCILAQQRRWVPWFAATMVLAALCAGWLIPWIDQGKYPGAVNTFRVLCGSVAVSFALSPHINVLFRAKDFAFMFWTMAVGLTMSALVMALFISRLQGVGAAWGVLLGFGAINLTVFARSRSLRRVQDLWVSPAEPSRLAA